MNFVEAVKSYFINWIDFKSRSSRSEFWWAWIFLLVVQNFTQVIVDYILGIVFSQNAILIVTVISILVMQIFICIATASIIVRRLHDVNKSGWWYLIVFTVIGVIPIIFWFCSKGTEGGNRFGNDPLEITTNG